MGKGLAASSRAMVTFSIMPIGLKSCLFPDFRSLRNMQFLDSLQRSLFTACRGKGNLQVAAAAAERNGNGNSMVVFPNAMETFPKAVIVLPMMIDMTSTNILVLFVTA